MFELNIFGDNYLQYLATLSVSLLTTTFGLTASWSSPILPLLQSEDSPIGITLTMEEGSWVASLLLLVMPIGSPLLGPLMDKFGRRTVLLMSAIPIFGSWMLILFAKSVTDLYIARCIAGIANIAPLVGTVVYVGEISEPSIRGKLGMLNLLMIEFGVVFVTATGSYLSYSNTALSSSMFAVAFFITFYWMPESPYFYLRKGETDEARKVLQRLRGNKDIEIEILKMQADVKLEMSNRGTLRDVIRTPIYRKSVWIIIGLKTIQQFSGIPAIHSYMKTIFDQASTGLDSRQSIIIGTAVSIPAMFLGSLLIDKFGRKNLYYISASGCAISLFCEGIYFFMQNKLNRNMSSLGWLPLFGVFLFSVCRVLGIGSMPFIMTSELFPTNIKSIGLGIAFVYSGITAFLVTLLFPYMVEAFGIYVCFFIFAVVCVLGIPFTFFLIPETKGKTLHDIQDDMKNCDKN